MLLQQQKKQSSSASRQHHMHLPSTILLALGAVAHAKQVRFAGEHALAQTHYGNPNEGACLKDEAPVMVGASRSLRRRTTLWITSPSLRC